MTIKTTIHSMILIVALAIAALPALGRGLFYPCHVAACPPVIDGRIDETEWVAAERIELTEIVTGTRAENPAIARMMWDNTRLYLAFTVPETNVWARFTGRDAPAQPDFKNCNENFIRVFLDPDCDGKNYTEFHFNPANAIGDKWQSMPWQMEARKACGLPAAAVWEQHWEWDCAGLTSAVSINGTLNKNNDTDQDWTLEVAVPFAAMKTFAGTRPCPPKVGDVWRIQLGRRCLGQEDAPTNAADWTWPIVGDTDCHRPDTWGYLVFAGAHPPVLTNDFSALPKASFPWKMLWVRRGDLKTNDDVKRTVADAKRMGFTVIAAEPVANLVAEAHAQGLKVFSWMINLRGRAAEVNPDRAQQVRPLEKMLIGRPRMDPDRENISGGAWLCPDRGLLDVERARITRHLSETGADGLAMDYIGYRNYYACFCPYSENQRAEYARCHPELSPAQVLWKYSEESLIRYCKQVCEAARAVKPDAGLAIHIYPDFDPNPEYANRLPVDYAGQTVAWFFTPFWSYGTVAGLTAQYKAAEGRFEKNNKFIPFIGAYGSDRSKSPDRLRTEIRIAGASAPAGIMIAYYETFFNDPALAAVLAEELK